MKTPALFALSTLLATAVVAQLPAPDPVVTEIYGPFTPGAAITDNDAVLTSFLLSISSSAIQSLTQVTISFELTGTPAEAGFAGDLFASLLKTPVGGPVSVGDPSAILLNGVGITGANPVGFGYDGWNITLSDLAGTDIHTHSLVSGVLTGTFQPDGRLAPGDAARPSLLDVFNGGTGNGDWRLNLGDLAAGGTMQLVSWSLTLTGADSVSPVPESGTWAAGLGLAALSGALAWRRPRRN
jgi:hypothetical protein